MPAIELEAAANNAMIDHERFAKSFAAAAAQLERTVSAFQTDMVGIPQALRGAREALDAIGSNARGTAARGRRGRWRISTCPSPRFARRLIASSTKRRGSTIGQARCWPLPSAT